MSLSGVQFLPVCRKPRVPETVNETQHRVGKDAILALSLAVSGTRGFSVYLSCS
jgi:hypothetical protein